MPTTFTNITKNAVTATNQRKHGPWDVSSAVLLQTKDISAQDTSPESIFFKDDGLKMYVLGNDGGDVNQYALTTAWDVSTASFVQATVVSGQDSSPEAIFFKEDGLKMYMLGSNADEVNEYSLGTAWDISTLSFVRVFDITATSGATPRGLFFKPDGLKMYVLEEVTDKIYEYNLSTAWDISTLSLVQSKSVSNESTTPDGVFFKPDGLKMYFVPSNGASTVYEYDLSTAWDISTLTPAASFVINSLDRDTYALFFKPDGTKMYVTAGLGTGHIKEYNLGFTTNITKNATTFTNITKS